MNDSIPIATHVAVLDHLLAAARERKAPPRITLADMIDVCHGVFEIANTDQLQVMADRITAHLAAQEA